MEARCHKCSRMMATEISACAPRAASREETSPRWEGSAWPAATDDAVGRPRRLVPNMDGRAGCVATDKRREGGAEVRHRGGCQRPVRIAAGEHQHGQAAGREERDPSLQTSIAADKRRGGEGERRPAAAEISAPRKRLRGDVAAEAARQPQQLSPRADGRAGMSPQTSDGEGEWTRPTEGQGD